MPCKKNVEDSKRIEAFERTCSAARKVLIGNPRRVTAWKVLGDALHGLGQYEEALAAFENGLVVEPDNLLLWRCWRKSQKARGKPANSGQLHAQLGDAQYWLLRMGALWLGKQYAKASEASDRVLAIEPTNVTAARLGISCRLNANDWSRREADKTRISFGLSRNEFIVGPVDHRALCGREAELTASAKVLSLRFPPASNRLWNGERYEHERIRIAYMSTDFRAHPVGTLLVGCLEHHNRSQFEITGVYLAKGDGSAQSQRIAAAFHHVIQADGISDASVAKLIREREIDILVDLNGYSGGARSGILAHRPAPAQVNYLGYPGSMQLAYIDYLLADQVVIPEKNKHFYSETIVYLPNCYLPADCERPVSQTTPSRVEAGLPESGFVFACHNANYKVSPEVFDVWMRLLRSCSGSVIWLQSSNDDAVSNFRREAELRGVAPHRLIFAPRVARGEDHLARLRLADLFVDTLPFNAHSTASDALWVGLPVLTCSGETFSARVAASMLEALDIPELATTSLAGYEELAQRLASEPSLMAQIKEKLLANISRKALFDTDRSTRNLEAAYERIWRESKAVKTKPPISLAGED